MNGLQTRDFEIKHGAMFLWNNSNLGNSDQILSYINVYTVKGWIVSYVSWMLRVVENFHFECKNQLDLVSK